MVLSLVYFVLVRLVHGLAPSDRSDPGTGSRTSGAATSGQGAVAGRAPAAVPEARPDAARGGEPDPSERAVERVHPFRLEPCSVGTGILSGASGHIGAGGWGDRRSILRR